MQFCQAHCASPRCRVHGEKARNSDRSCHHPRCDARVQPKCTSGFCQSHCNSRKCQVHMKGRRCSMAECDFPPAPECLVGACVAHCDDWQCSRARMGRSRNSRRSNVLTNVCCDPSCDERVHPECSFRRCTLHCTSRNCAFHSTPNGRGGNPVRDGPAIASNESLCVASLNARRLWQRDQSVDDGFQVFSDFFLKNHIGVVCIQEVFAGDYPTLPSDQPYTYDGPFSSGERKAAFLVRASVCGSPVPGVADSTSVRWKVFNNAWCICSYYAPHAGLPQETRVRFWRDFVAVAQRVQNAVSVPMIITGGASSFQPLFIQIVSSRCAHGRGIPVCSHVRVSREPKKGDVWAQVQVVIRERNTRDAANHVATRLAQQ